MFGYAGVIAAITFMLGAIGIDLQKIAFVAGALSVGIGFGLQNIVSNFVSGLILLVERPFKVGDWIVSGTSEGIVKRISVRATEIETFRKQSIIVPNSELINASLGNWTHRNRVARSEIPVSVGYDSDPKQVMAILLELVQTVPKVLRNPEPNVEFLRFGPLSLDFEMRFFLSDLSDGMAIRNNLRVAILERFRREGIVMPLAAAVAPHPPQPPAEEATIAPNDAASTIVKIETQADKQPSESRRPPRPKNER
jgi:small-conductance mechanosensitive channel